MGCFEYLTARHRGQTRWFWIIFRFTIGFCILSFVYSLLYLKDYTAAGFFILSILLLINLHILEYCYKHGSLNLYSHCLGRRKPMKPNEKCLQRTLLDMCHFIPNEEELKIIEMKAKEFIQSAADQKIQHLYTDTELLLAGSMAERFSMPIQTSSMTGGNHGILSDFDFMISLKNERSDIRSFFGGKKSNGSIDKIDKNSQKSTTKKKTKKSGNDEVTRGKKKKRVVIESDSEEEEPLPSSVRKSKVEPSTKKKEKTGSTDSKRKKNNNNDPDLEITHTSPAVKKKPKKSLTPPKKEILKPTTASDFFGNSKPTASGSTKRKKTESPDESKKDISSKDKKKEEKNEPELLLDDDDDDDDFDVAEIDKSLDIPPPSKKQKKSEASPAKRQSPRKQKKSEASPVKRQSPRKKSKDAEERDEEIVLPTPDAKLGKSKSLANKLSSKAKLDVKLAETSTKNETVDPTETKMKDAVKRYIEQAKDVEEKREQKSKNEPAAHTPVRKDDSQKVLAENTPSTPSSTGDTPIEKKKNNYFAYKHRDGPSALGSKEMPEGAENCLEGLTFVITGVYESFERDEIVDCVQRYGGKVTTGVSGRTSYVLVGRGAGESKLEKARKHNTKQLSEDDFLELVRTRPGKSGTAVVATPKRTKSKSKVIKEEPSTPIIKTPNATKKLNSESPLIKSESQDSLSISDFSQSSSSQLSYPAKKSQHSTASTPSQRSQSQNTQSPVVSSQDVSKGGPSTLLWVDKYKPKAMRNIVGQQGDRSNANKLKKWLLKWKLNNSADKPKGNYLSGKEDGSIFKAALLSGPPGVGKTTTATLVCQEVGFTFVEMNASDTRGKKALDSVIKESLSNVTVNGMLKEPNSKGDSHVLIMDEVDGMAGNEDRGGMQELIQLIKKSKIPIICMCNDRTHPKVRSLANYCFDLRFYKPRVEQIKGFALSIAAKEGLKIPPQAMERIVVGTNQDIRQVDKETRDARVGKVYISFGTDQNATYSRKKDTSQDVDVKNQVVHNLQMWTATTNTISYDEAKEKAASANKNIKLGPFDIVKQLFTESESSKMSLNDRSDLFFMDYSFIPLFVQENYASVRPAKARGNQRRTLELISETADSIADANIVERLIRGENNWSLLPLQGFMSTVVPSMNMSGYLGQRIDFPQWLGKNSSRGKHDRILQELKTHMALSCDCAKADINLEYLSTFKRRLKQPLLDTEKGTSQDVDVKNQSLEANAAVREVISLMDSYNLTREDWDSVMDIGKWGNEAEVKIPTKVKSAFTRQYNKETHKTPYAVHQTAKKTKTKATASEDVLKEENDGDDVVGEEDDEDNDDDISNDAMIKVAKEPAAGSSKGKTTKGASKTKAESKGKGKGKARKK